MCFYEVYSSVMIGVLSTLQTDGTYSQIPFLQRFRVYRQVTYSFNDKNELKIEYRYSKRRDKIEGMKARFARMKVSFSNNFTIFRSLILCTEVPPLPPLFIP